MTAEKDRPENICHEYRANYDVLRDEPASLAAGTCERLEQHVQACASCRVYRSNTEQILTMSGELPQFDVPERVTQSIISLVQSQNSAAVTGQYGLLLPVSAVCLAGAFTVVPLDSWDGLVSTVIALVGLAILKLLISSVQTEELMV